MKKRPPPPPKKTTQKTNQKTLWPHPIPKDDDMNELEFTQPNKSFTYVSI